MIDAARQLAEVVPALAVGDGFVALVQEHSLLFCGADADCAASHLDGGACTGDCAIVIAKDEFEVVQAISQVHRRAEGIGKLSAIANTCAHQNGPLGEGRILDCLVTCPWHGFQYDVSTGRSPAPFTEKVPTYTLRMDEDLVLVDPNPNPPGTFVEPLQVGKRENRP